MEYEGWEAFVSVINMRPPGCHAGFGLLVITHKISFASCVCILYSALYVYTCTSRCECL